jgi:hypothetical protein
LTYSEPIVIPSEETVVTFRATDAAGNTSLEGSLTIAAVGDPDAAVGDPDPDPSPDVSPSPGPGASPTPRGTATPNGGGATGAGTSSGSNGADLAATGTDAGSAVLVAALALLLGGDWH